MKNLYNYVKTCMNELDRINVPYGKVVDIEVNTRAKRMWGRCTEVRGGYCIEINQYLLDDRNSDFGLKSTIMHELLHTVKGCFNHGELWKRYAAKVNNAYGYNVKRTNSAEDKMLDTGVTKELSAVLGAYIIKCDKCGAVVRRQKMSKCIQHPEKYRCRCCGGNFVRVS